MITKETMEAIRFQMISKRPVEKPEEFFDFSPCDLCWELTSSDDLTVCDNECLCPDCARSIGCKE